MSPAESAAGVTPEERYEDGELILREAVFDQRFVVYTLVATTIVLTLTCVGILILPIYLPIAAWLHKKQLAHMRLVLTQRSLKVERGVLNRVEKTIPLDKITDLALFQGPIMRHYELEGLRVETAGQTSAAGAALVNMIGVIDARPFREAVLAQRDALQGKLPAAPQATSPAGVAQSSPGEAAASSEQVELLRELRDAVVRIEKRLDER